MDDQSIRLLLVDDHPVVLQGLRTFLAARPGLEVIAEAMSGEDALARLAETAAGAAPDVVLMDLVMPGMGGVAATGEVTTGYPDVAVLVLTSFTSDDQVLAAVRAGAAGYVLKDAQPAELEAAIRAVAHGEVYLHPAAAAAVVHAVTRGVGDPTPTTWMPEGFDQLTAREREVLGLLGEGLSNAALGERLFISEKTVKTHVSSILAKLDVTDRTQAALLAVRAGLRLKTEEETGL